MSESSNASNKKGKHEIMICKRCGTNFECKVGDVSNCQCSTISLSDATRKFLDSAHFECLCANCLADLEHKVSLLKDMSFPKPSEQIKNIHYYIENGFYVFTEQYHMLRGTCCSSGCRHCPYGFNKQKG